MCLDVAGNYRSPPDGAKIHIWSCNGGATQHWRAGPGNTLVNQSDGKCLDDPNATNVNGTQLQLWSCDGRIRQHVAAACRPGSAAPAAGGDRCIPPLLTSSTCRA